jgi:uncharacterized protein (DUF3084 family)
MAKALLGYVGDGDARSREQARVLRRRVSELEAQVRRLEAEKTALRAALHDSESLRIPAVRAEYQPA